MEGRDSGRDIITAKVLAIDIGGALDDIGYTELTEKVFVSIRHCKGGKDTFVAGMP